MDKVIILYRNMIKIQQIIIITECVCVCKSVSRVYVKFADVFIRNFIQ